MAIYFADEFLVVTFAKDYFFFLLVINCVSTCKASTNRKNTRANRISKNKYNLILITE